MGTTRYGPLCGPGCYVDIEERERFLLDTFGSQPWLWNTPDGLRFDPGSRELVGPNSSCPPAVPIPRTSPAFPPHPPVHPGGLRTDEVRDFRLALRDLHEDRHRADAPHSLITDLVEDYGDW
ncbi:hypothetical protein [Streptomyces violascens]|uniref:hypothetical protein n=1 Tax=Streptomyces violascens TaxID=67381 RepID=UPI0036A33A7D